MGYSRWDGATYDSYAKTTNYRAASTREMFKHTLNEKLDPRNVKVGKGDRKGLQLRESIISEQNPDPTPIILGLDVTGSMGDVARQIAAEELPKLMTAIHDTKVVSDPHVMFMGIDDVYAQGYGALQVSYFEPDLKIVEQLRNMWLVQNGGGNGSESYDLAWYFAGRYTYSQNFEVTGKKGFLVTFGDEPVPFRLMEAEHLKTIFGPGDYEAVTPENALEMAKAKYHVFHVSIEKGGYDLSGWDRLLGTNHLRLRASDVPLISDVVLAMMEIVGGANIHEVIARSKHSRTLEHAFRNALK